MAAAGTRCQISTTTVQYSACATFSELRSTPITTGPPAMPTYVHLRAISLGIAARPATHNPLVHGSSPCGPTKQESRAMRGFFVSVGILNRDERLPKHHSVGEILDSDLALRKGRDNFQFAAHGADVVSQGADVHVCAPLHSGDRCLVNVQRLGQRFLTQLLGLTQLAQRHFFQVLLEQPLCVSARLRRHVVANQIVNGGFWLDLGGRCLAFGCVYLMCRNIG